MARSLLAPIILSAIIGCTDGSSVPDELKFQLLEKLCRERSSEFVTEESADGRVILLQTHVSEPKGSAARPALDLEYASGYLFPLLLSGYDALPEVVFSSGSRGTNIQIPEQCRRHHYLVATSHTEAKALLRRCDPSKILESLDGEQPVRYAIGIEYGELDKHEIRSFTFFIKDRTSGRVLAQQDSYQLLLGGMKSEDARVFHGWGSSQGVRNCRLTPPDQIVKKVFR